ncbi:FHA domain-containing protein, partial [Streptomyces beigongshangae]|uniref:FHA domain-containing protein n=1 Tax=Streptomyces beigongshangae TaxID=2841597 RepID=UPI001C85DCAC
MQIRLTVVDPLGTRPDGRPASCDVLVTAPAGTALAAVASGLASAVGGEGPGVLYAEAERLDAQRCTLGEPPLVDGAVLSLGAPAQPGPDVDPDAAQLRVVAGPDAGGVHLLHGGRIDIGRSADADVPLDDPDVSRLHCAVTVAADGRVSVADLGSTNGTVLDGRRVDGRPVRFAPGALLRVGESALQLAPAGEPPAVRETAPDGEGHIRVVATGTSGRGRQRPAAPREPGRDRGREPAPDRSRSQEQGQDAGVPRARDGGSRVGPPTAETHHGYGTAGWGAAEGGAPEPQGHLPAGPPGVPRQGGASRGEYAEPGEPAEEGPEVQGPGEGRRKGTPLRGTPVPRGARRRGLSAWARRLAGTRGEDPYDPYGHDADDDPYEAAFAEPVPLGVPEPERWPDPAALLLAALGPGPRLWERGPGHREMLTVRLGTADRSAPDGSALLPAVPVTAALREVGALGLAGPRERLSGLARAVVAQLAALHSPDSLEITLLSTDRARSVEERTAEWSWLGWLPHLRPTHGQDCRLLLAYDREQAAARTEELLRRLDDHLAEAGRAAGEGPGARPGAGSPDDGGAFEPRRGSAADTGAGSPPGTYAADRGGRDTAGARVPDRGPSPSVPAPGRHPLARDDNATHLGLPRSGSQTGGTRGGARQPSWARPDDPARTGWPGPCTVVVVDGDPGSAGVRDAVSRLAAEGPRVGIHVVCLAETPAASPSSPVADTYEAACSVSPVFRGCGAVALLSGDVATALRLLRVAPGAPGTPDGGGPVGHGTLAAVDAVSMAWAERFARALAPLRADGAAGGGHPRVSAPLPQTAR